MTGKFGGIGRASLVVINALERFFYWWGKFTARRPFLVISACLLVTGLTTVGLKWFWVEADTNVLWIPSDSDYHYNERWINRHIKGPATRLQVLLFKSKDNVLTAENVREMQRFHVAVLKIESNGLTYKDVCYELPIADIFLDKRRRKRQAEGTDSSSSYGYDYGYDYGANEYDYDTYANYDPDDGSVARENVIYNDFDSLVEDDGYQEQQKQVGADLPNDVYCQLISTLNKKCFESSILEIWRYHNRTIESLDQEGVLYPINALKRSPHFGYGFNYTTLLGSIAYNGSDVVGAKVATHLWLTRVVSKDNPSLSPFKINLGSADRISLDWELQVVRLAEEFNEEWAQRGVDLQAEVNVARSFTDVSSKAIFVDMVKMAAGFAIMFVYTILMLGRMNRVETRLYLTGAGLFAVLMGLTIAVSLTAAFGLPYTPIHGMLPFLFLGIGIDDMFVIVQCLNNLGKENEDKPLEERIGLTMKHAGVAITVTSFTDVFAFGVGAFTILPGLKTFCVSCAIGIASIYLLQATWFVAWLTIDERRIMAKRSSFFPCFVKYGDDWEPSSCVKEEFGRLLFKTFSKALDHHLPKMLIVLLTLGVGSVGVWGTLNIRIEFDPVKLLPAGTYLKKWTETRAKHYPQVGYEAFLVTAELDPYVDLEKFDDALRKLKEADVILDVITWFDEFKVFLAEREKIDDWRETIRLDEDGYNKNNFSYMISNFVFSDRGAKFKGNLEFDGEVKCDVPAPKILATKSTIKYRLFSGPEEHVPARRLVQKILKDSEVSSKFFTFAQIYAAWETDEIIGQELWRNLGLAMLCVAVISLLLLADVAICFLVLVCVVLTLVDVVGMLSFWGVTIDTLSCVNIVLAVGLCVDYSAHIAHAFTVSTGTRTERAKNSLLTMGSAVANGGITTFLALVLLGFSESHVFVTFFKVFLLTVIFGLFHGIVFLPVVLSYVGSTRSHPISDENEHERKSKMDMLDNPAFVSDHKEATRAGAESRTHVLGEINERPGWRPHVPGRFHKTLPITD